MLNISSVEERLNGYQPMWENWYIDSQIYNGVNSRVYRIKRNRDGINEYAAMKVVTVTLDDDKMFISQSDGMKYLNDRCRQAKVEINNMIKLQRSPYIVSYYGDAVKEILNQDGAKCGYDMMIRMEYLTCFGTKIRNSDKGITEQDVINLAFDIGNALKAVHKCNMIHRDIKPDNIFVDEEGNYKLGDLGVTKNLNATGYASTKTGTEPYAAPEVWRTDKYTENSYTYKADIYSFGIVLYQLLNNNYLPFMNDFTHNEIEKSIALRMRGETVPVPVNGGEGLKKIICKMCEYDPDNRYNDISTFLNELSTVEDRVYNDSSDITMTLDNGVICDDMMATLNANDDVDDDQNSELNPSAYSEVSATITESADNQNNNKVNDLIPSVSHEITESEFISEFDTNAEFPKDTQSEEENRAQDPERAPNTQLAEKIQANHKETVVLTNNFVIPCDGIFRSKDYRKCRVKHGVLDIPEGYCEIDSFTFYGIERDLITKIIMPESIKRINEATFKGFINLKEINLSDNIMIIRKSIFEECQSLENLIIPLNVRKIEDYAFNGCRSLKTIDIYGYVTGIGQNVFIGCDNITVRCKENSFVHHYCLKHNIKTELI